MAELFLVRHAQAAFGTDDYDRLTELGHRQARWLGEYFLDRNLRFDRAVAGTLRRHRETLEGVSALGVVIGAPRTDARLDEYDPQRLVAAHLAARQYGQDSLPMPQPHALAPDVDRRDHFRLLKDALTSWTQGQVDAQGHRPFSDFQADAFQAFEQACRPHPSAQRVLVVSSGGPIASILARQLDMPPASFVALNLQLRNSGFCEVRFNDRGAQVVSFNNIPHLDTPQRRQYITFS